MENVSGNKHKHQMFCFNTPFQSNFQDHNSTKTTNTPSNQAVSHSVRKQYWWCVLTFQRVYRHTKHRNKWTPRSFMQTSCTSWCITYMISIRGSLPSEVETTEKYCDILHAPLNTSQSLSCSVIFKERERESWERHKSCHLIQTDVNFPNIPDSFCFCH